MFGQTQQINHANSCHTPMPTLDSLALFLGATLLLNLTPGPDMLYIIARASAQGRTAGLVSALGISAGCVVHLLLVVLGVAGLLTQWPMGLRLLQLGGALYLLWIGMTMLRNHAEHSAHALAPQTLQQVFYQGVVTNALNPKVALFFLAFLPQFADPQRGSLALQLSVPSMRNNRVASWRSTYSTNYPPRIMDKTRQRVVIA